MSSCVLCATSHQQLTTKPNKMRTLVVIAVLIALFSIASAFSLLREFDDERLLPHVNRIRRAASSSEESAEAVKGSGQEGSGERVARDAELKEASGEAEKEKTRKRRDTEAVVGSGQEEGSGEGVSKPSVRRRRSAEAEEQVESSGQEVEGSGQA